MKRLSVMLITVVLWSISCSTKRQLKSDASQQSEMHSSVQRKVDLTQLDTLKEMWLHRNYDLQEALVLSPVGAFRYHPDSGFIGKASQVVVYRQKAMQEDSLQFSGSRLVSKVSIALTDSSHIDKRSEATNRSVAVSTGWSWWIVGLSVILVASLAWLLRKRFWP
ncbi:hypothetical protein SAMN05216436_12117 [bacterium A37T11]|nr:hypothetical protein SAMN05216436_12117 [bacterium A37T11]